MNIDALINKIAYGKQSTQSRWAITALWICMFTICLLTGGLMLATTSVTIPVQLAITSSGQLTVVVPDDFAPLIQKKSYDVKTSKRNFTQLPVTSWSYDNTSRRWILVLKQVTPSDQTIDTNGIAKLVLARPSAYQLLFMKKEQILSIK